MPSHDHAPHRSASDLARIARERFKAQRFIDAITRRRRRPKRRDGENGEGVPIDPTRPGTLDGGAAAALEFDD